MLAMTPNRRRRIPGSTASMPAYGAMKFTSMTARADSTVAVPVRITPPTPATLSSASMRL
jgi:hypothetical protein